MLQTESILWVAGLTLNLDAKIEMLPTGVHVTAIPKDKKYTWLRRDLKLN